VKKMSMLAAASGTCAAKDTDCADHNGRASWSCQSQNGTPGQEPTIRRGYPGSVVLSSMSYLTYSVPLAKYAFPSLPMNA
jgi:hypothetical protein